MKILGIETSCDETAIALLEVDGQVGQPVSQWSVAVLENLVTSQIPIHERYGGVVPEIAARSHVPETVALLDRVMGNWSGNVFEAIAVTNGPGLPTALSVGVEAARVLAGTLGTPIIGVHHLEGHVASAWLNQFNRERWNFPLLALIVSGGHTELVLMKKLGSYRIIGSTRDDAAGEAFDKCAKLMGMSYPGGPKLANLAERGDPLAFVVPRPMLHEPGCEMSFSGLKTAVRQLWESLPTKPNYDGLNSPQLLCDLAAAVQAAIVDVLIEKTRRAVHQARPGGVLLVGGVSANQSLRERLARMLQTEFPTVEYLPSDKGYITDNAAMIAAAGAWHIVHDHVSDWKKLDIQPERVLRGW